MRKKNVFDRFSISQIGFVEKSWIKFWDILGFCPSGDDSTATCTSVAAASRSFADANRDDRMGVEVVSDRSATL